MKKHLAVSLMALLLCGGALVANAQGPEGGPHKAWGGPGHGTGMGMGLALHELNLTDAQKAQVKQIMQANHASMKPLMTQMEQNRAAMLAVTANGQYDQAKIQALAAQAGQLHAAMIANHEAVAHQIYTQVLTADQQAKAEQLRTEKINRINEHIQKIANGTNAPPSPAQ
jgi:Spy/CpxP family protein refolding chaperone